MAKTASAWGNVIDAGRQAAFFPEPQSSETLTKCCVLEQRSRCGDARRTAKDLVGLADDELEGPYFSSPPGCVQSRAP